jgi:hypothetical protein
MSIRTDLGLRYDILQKQKDTNIPYIEIFAWKSETAES